MSVRAMGMDERPENPLPAHGMGHAGPFVPRGAMRTIHDHLYTNVIGMMTTWASASCDHPRRALQPAHLVQPLTKHLAAAIFEWGLAHGLQLGARACNGRNSEIR